jgi:hypothetical protein
MGMGMESEGIEVYLSRDIIQGEEVPFYILWNRDDIQRIIISLDGFESVTEYHNVRDNISLEERTLELEDLKSPQYLGGVLKTNETDNPYRKANLRVVFELSSGETIEVNEERTLYTTHLRVVSPDLVEIPFNESPIEIQMKGSTTIFIDVESASDSDIKITLPDEIKDIFDKIYQSLIAGLESLKDENPEHSSEIDLLISFISEEDIYKLSEEEYFRKFDEIMQIFRSNKTLQEGFTFVYVNSILGQGSARHSLFRPLLEYFESNAAKKVFLESPFLSAKVPKGGGYLKAVIYYEDIIERTNIMKEIIEESVSFRDFLRKLKDFERTTEKKRICTEIIFESKDEVIIPIKNLINIRRIS